MTVVVMQGYPVLAISYHQWPICMIWLIGYCGFMVWVLHVR